MDFRLKNLPKVRPFPSKQDRLRVVAKHVPHAQALATSWLLRVRPIFATLYSLRRKLATIAVTLVAGFLFAHVMFGVNGMVVYKQKRAEYESLQKRILLEQKENQLYTQQIQGLKTDEKSIEKEAR